MDLHKIPCPTCKRKGLHYAPHPHVFRPGWKDYSTVICRFCKTRYPADDICLKA